MTKEVAQFRASLCPTLTTNGSDASCCRLGLLAHKTKNDDTKFNADFKQTDYKPDKDLAGDVKAELGSLQLNEEKAILSEGSFLQISPGEKLDICSPFIISLFVAIAPLKSDSMALTPCQPAVHLRPASLSQDLLTPAIAHKTYIEHVAGGGDKDLFRQPLETIVYSTDPEAGAAISPVEILDICQFRQIPKGRLANHIKLEHVQEAFQLLVADPKTLPHFLPTNLQDQNEVPIVLFFALLAALHQKYNGLKSDDDWLAMLSALTGLSQPQVDLSVSSTADLHYITRVLFAEKVRCKIAIAKGLRRFLLTYHISQMENPPETMQHILKPSLLCVSDTGIFSDPCPLTVTATVAGPDIPAGNGNPTTFEQMMDEDRSRRMKEAWLEKERRRPSSLQDFLLEWLAELQRNYSTGLLTSSKQLSEGLTKAQQTTVFKEARVVASTVLLEVYEARCNVQVTEMVHDYEVYYKKLNPDCPDQWKAKLEQSLSEEAKAKKMISKQMKAGPLNVFVSILTQLVFIVDGPDGCQQLENVDLLFQVVHQNGCREQKPLSSEKFDPLLCKDNLKRRWQEIIFESRETIVKLISAQIKKGNKSLVENVIRPRATTLVLRLVAHFGIHCVSVPDHCRTEMPSFCSLVFDDTKVGAVHAYCKVITEYVCFLLEEQKEPKQESPLWLPQSLLVWVNDATDKTRNSVGLMPTITLAKSGIDQSEDQSRCVSELLVCILEDPDESLFSLKASIEDHCHQFLQLEQQNAEEKKQKKQGKGSSANKLLDLEAEASSHDNGSVTDEPSPQTVLGSPDALPPTNKDWKDDGPISDISKTLEFGDRTLPESNGSLGGNSSPRKARAPTMLDGLQLGSAAQLSPSMHTFLMTQLSLNHGALPNALVNVVETGVQFMAEKRFGNYDPSILSSFNEPEKQRKRRRLNEEHMGHMYVVIEKLMTLHAQELERQFQSEKVIDWKNATGDVINVAVKPRTVHNPSELRCIGNELLGTAGRHPVSSVGQKQEEEESVAEPVTEQKPNPATGDSKLMKKKAVVSPVSITSPAGSVGSSYVETPLLQSPVKPVKTPKAKAAKSPSANKGISPVYRKVFPKPDIGSSPSSRGRRSQAGKS